MFQEDILIKTSLHPCSIESHPSRNMIACGQYELEEDSGGLIRNGAIVLYSAITGEALFTLKVTGGVLDMKWRDAETLGCVTSTSILYILKLQSDGSLTELARYVDEHEEMFLSLDWADRLTESSSPPQSYGLVAVSTQKGNVLMLQVSSGVRLQQRLTGHVICGSPVPCWIAVLDPHSKTTVLSGGDDCMLRLWDTRSGVASVNKSHGAGVTSGQWHPRCDHLFFTGSYDETVRVFDCRRLSSPLSSLAVGGGVWRLKSFPVQREEEEEGLILLAACMHGGSRILHCPSNRDLRCLVERRNSSDRLLVYGVDLMRCERRATGLDELRVASCSFYEDALEMWSCSVRYT